MTPKGYIVNEGFMGWLDGRYMLFATEQDYLEIFTNSLETN
jgi:hypothetical protein